MDTPAVAERYTDAAGTRTRYLEAGRGDPIIMLHGGQFGSLGCADDWKPIIPLLARRYRVLAIDKIGSGWTDNPKSDDQYVIGSTVTHLLDFMKAVGVERAHLMGHSRGGYTIVRTAMDHPKAVRSLLVVSSASLMSAPNSVYEEWDRQAAQFSDPKEQWRHRLGCNSFSGDHLTEDFLDVNVAMEALPKHQEARRKMGDRKMDKHLLWHRFRSDLIEQQKSMRPRIARDGLPCPLLLLWGFDDPSARLDPTGIDALRLLLPAASASEFHVFKNAGHYVYREQPDRFASVVADFLEDK